MTPLETAIYAAAYVDAFKEIFNEHPVVDRVWLSSKEAEFVVDSFRKHKRYPESTAP